MILVWLFAQLVFWLAACGLLIVVVLVVILAPPFLAGRAIWRRLA